MVSLLSAGLLFYSQTAAFAWDEGFHVLTAQLIKTGKMPYRDFLFPQTPLNAYWNAGWMRILGDTWRTPHGMAALLSGVALLLTADFVFVRFPVPSWQLAAALTAAVTMGLNTMVIQFGTVGQAYGTCLLLIVAAFRLTVIEVDRDGWRLAGLAGLLAGAGACSSLLTAPVAPVLLLWMLLYNRRGGRWAKCIAFLAGGAMAFLPVLWLYIKAPRQTIFNIFEYHMFYRQLEWAGAIPHDMGVLTDWLDSSQALVLLLLAAIGLFFVMRRSGWDRARRAEFYLCAWLAAAVTAHISSAHPTFDRYYLLTVPFLSILAAAGLYFVTTNLFAPARPYVPVAVLALLMAAGFGKSVSDRTDQYFWRTFEKIAAQVQQVTPPGAPLLADEHVYFLTRRVPPSGMELADSHKLQLPAPMAELVHSISRAELERRIKSGVYATVENCQDEDDNNELGLPRLYAHKATFEDCTVFWGKPAVTPAPSKTSQAHP